MNCLINIRNFILRFDLFAASPTLRVRGQSSYETFWCGIFSLLLIGVFAGIFAGQVLDVLQKAQIQAVVNRDDNPQSDSQISGIHFALGLQQLTFEEVQPYFDIILRKVQKRPMQPNIVENIQLQFCTRDTWSSYGEGLDKYFDAMHVENKYCVPKDSDVTLYGYEGSQSWNKMELIIERCKGPQPGSNLTNNCANQNEFQEFIENYGSFRVRMLFVDTIISPSKKDPISLALEKDIFLSFSDVLGSRGEITLARYEIQTDESILPFSIIQQITGHYIESFQTTASTISIQNQNPQNRRNDKFVELQIKKSTLIYSVQRVHQKIDDLLSYIGGLFALIFFVVFFFFGSYNQYRYELMVAQSSFSYDDHGEKVREKDLTVWKYFIYSLYDWLKMFGIRMKWATMQKIDEAREQANEQLDIRLIMKKIRYFEWSLNLLLDGTHRVASQIVKPLTIKQSRQYRKLLEYYDKVMKNKLTDNKYDDVYNIFGMANKHKMLPIQQMRYKMLKKQGKVAQAGNKNKKVKKNSQQKIDYTNSDILQNEKGLDIYEQKDEKKNKQGRWQKSKADCQGQEIKTTKKQPSSQQQQIQVQDNEKCCDLFPQIFDSEDEEVQRNIYKQYQKLKADNSQRAVKIKGKIPQYLKMRMEKKQESNSRQDYEDEKQSNQKNNHFKELFINLGVGQ